MMTPQEKRDQIRALRVEIGQIEIGGKRPPKFTLAQRRAVLEKYEGRCAVCHDELQPGWPVDHIKAWADGGAHTLANWQALCQPCHALKTGPENSRRAKPNRLREIEANGRQPCARPIQARPDPWPTGQKLRSRNTFQNARREPMTAKTDKTGCTR